MQLTYFTASNEQFPVMESDETGGDDIYERQLLQKQQYVSRNQLYRPKLFPNRTSYQVAADKANNIKVQHKYRDQRERLSRLAHHLKTSSPDLTAQDP